MMTPSCRVSYSGGDGGGRIYPQHEFDMGDIPPLPINLIFLGKLPVLKI
jgi:hypothetical protein